MNNTPIERLETCTFEEYSWTCKNDGYPFCDKHKDQKCFECGKQATKYCCHEMMFVCGEPECDDHYHNHS